MEVPPNAHINLLGNGWDCDDGFRQGSDRCERMSEAEQLQQAAQRQRLLDLLETRQTAGGGCIESSDGSHVSCGGAQNALGSVSPGLRRFNLSAAQRFTQAQVARDIVEDRMTAEQVAQAQRRARAWTPTPAP